MVFGQKESTTTKYCENKLINYAANTLLSIKTKPSSDETELTSTIGEYNEAQDNLVQDKQYEKHPDMYFMYFVGYMVNNS